MGTRTSLHWSSHVDPRTPHCDTGMNNPHCDTQRQRSPARLQHCVGDEASLADCSVKAWGKDSCDNEDGMAGVVCLSTVDGTSGESRVQPAVPARAPPPPWPAVPPVPYSVALSGGMQLCGPVAHQ